MSKNSSGKTATNHPTIEKTDEMTKQPGRTEVYTDGQHYSVDNSATIEVHDAGVYVNGEWLG